MKMEDIEFNLIALKNNFLFTNLNDTEYEVIISNMFFGEVKEGEFIFRQNDKASCFFVIQSGEFSVVIDGVEKKTLKEGHSFGELALLYNAPRSAGLKALKTSYIWGIERPIFKKVLKDMNNKEQSENLAILNKSEFLKGLT